ncbi:protein kinase [Nocardia sp. NPDC058176]|uniref:serine/threonine-protein kinase n=1 Tax=Nocardia sp. NPDC058176 TaxID=3346368 RepID=UPI0036D9DA31
MLESGEVFAGFTIERLLGQGGMGTVYLARHPRLDRLTALKLLNRDLFADERIRARFEREADLAAGLDHPGIVTVYDRGTEGEQLWISMQYVDGVDGATVDPMTLPPERAVQIIEGVADALDFAHERGVLHRDVKPANILLARSSGGQGERVFLTDFGIARLRADSTHLTQQGMFTATLAYASPEQMTGAELDHRSDQYSLACALYWLFTGVAPFDSPDPNEIIRGTLYLGPPPLALRRPGLPPVMDAVLAAAMAKHPAARFDSCTAFAKAARQALTSTTPPVLPRPVPNPAPPYPPQQPAPAGPFPPQGHPAPAYPAPPIPPAPQGNWQPQAPRPPAVPSSPPPHRPPAAQAPAHPYGTPQQQPPQHAPQQPPPNQQSQVPPAQQPQPQPPSQQQPPQVPSPSPQQVPPAQQPQPQPQPQQVPSPSPQQVSPAQPLPNQQSQVPPAQQPQPQPPSQQQPPQVPSPSLQQPSPSQPQVPPAQPQQVPPQPPQPQQATQSPPDSQPLNPAPVAAPGGGKAPPQPVAEAASSLAEKGVSGSDREIAAETNASSGTALPGSGIGLESTTDVSGSAATDVVAMPNAGVLDAENAAAQTDVTALAEPPGSAATADLSRHRPPPAPGSSDAAQPDSGGAALPGSGGAVQPRSGGEALPSSGDAVQPGSGGVALPGSSGAVQPSSGGVAEPGSVDADSEAAPVISLDKHDPSGEVMGSPGFGSAADPASGGPGSDVAVGEIAAQEDQGARANPLGGHASGTAGRADLQGVERAQPPVAQAGAHDGGLVPRGPEGESAVVSTPAQVSAPGGQPVGAQAGAPDGGSVRHGPEGDPAVASAQVHASPQSGPPVPGNGQGAQQIPRMAPGMAQQAPWPGPRPPRRRPVRRGISRLHRLGWLVFAALLAALLVLVGALVVVALPDGDEDAAADAATKAPSSSITAVGDSFQASRRIFSTLVPQGGMTEGPGYRGAHCVAVRSVSDLEWKEPALQWNPITAGWQCERTGTGAAAVGYLVLEYPTAAQARSVVEALPAPIRFSGDKDDISFSMRRWVVEDPANSRVATAHQVVSFPGDPSRANYVVAVSRWGSSGVDGAPRPSALDEVIAWWEEVPL